MIRTETALADVPAARGLEVPNQFHRSSAMGQLGRERDPTQTQRSLAVGIRSPVLCAYPKHVALRVLARAACLIEACQFGAGG